MPPAGITASRSRAGGSRTQRVVVGFAVVGLMAAACSSPPAHEASRPGRTATQHEADQADPDARDGGAVAQGLDPQIHEDASGRTRPDLYAAAMKQLSHMPVDTGAGGVGAAAAPLAWTQIGPQPDSQPEEDSAIPRSGTATVTGTTVTGWAGYGVDATLIGASVTGAGIPQGTTIASILSSNSFTMSASGPSSAAEQLTIDIPVKDPPMAFGGTVWDIAISPAGTTDTTVYIAGAGGIWKTTDGGAHWSPTTDFITAPDGSPVTESFSSVALDPANPAIVYAGTGVYFDAHFNRYYGAQGDAVLGNGVFRSADGGATWSQTPGSGALGHRTITRIVVPSPGVVLAATSSGLFRSTDSGAHFNEVATGGSTGLVISDLDMRPGTTSPIWASAEGLGVVVSTDQGASFNTNLWSSNGAPQPNSYWDVQFAVSSDGNTMYADVFGKDANNPLAGLWKSTNGGSTWSTVPSIFDDHHYPSWREPKGCQCGYAQTLAVDPSNANHVYMGFTDIWSSTNGGTSWTNLSAPQPHPKTHVDQHAIAFSPATHRVANQPAGVWVGMDGGVWSSANGGATWANHNATFATNLLYGIGTGYGDYGNQFTYGGMQDDGTAVGSPSTTGNLWHEYCGGDGNQVAVDYLDPNIAIDGRDCRTSDGGTTLESHVGITCSNVSTQPVFDPNHTANVYDARSCGGAPVIVKSTNHATTFSTAHWYTSSAAHDGISSMAITRSATPQMWVGFRDGSIVKLSNLGGAPAESNWQQPAGGEPAHVAVDPADPNRVAVVYAGYSGQHYPADSGHVWLSTDGGASFHAVGGTSSAAQSVPDMPVYAAVFDTSTSPSSLIIATDGGVLRSQDTDTTKTWQVLGDGLPHVQVTSLAIDTTVVPPLLKAGTYGRSAWKIWLGNPTPSPWQHLLTRSGRLALGFDTYGREELFAVGGDGTLQTTFQLRNGGWSGLVSLGGTLRNSPAQPIAVGQNADGRLEVYAIGMDGYMYTKYQTVATGAVLGLGADRREGLVARVRDADSRLRR